ncbi:MAG: PLP-dependent aminotransferase family protein [Deltaproteobacteria bacterium]|nr:PLP-dependent aminotransferase family protein [Deltaproteobacteria bacterium]
MGETLAGGFLYEHLADELGQAIDRGALRAGDRLPSVRRLAEERSVSVSTVLEAYLQLENAGLIEVRPKSGHYVRRRAAATPDPRVPRPCQKPSRVTVSDAYTKILTAMRDPELVPLGCATVDASYLPSAQINRIITQVTREMVTLGSRYEAAPGLLTLRRQVARRAVESGMSLHENDLCTTIGATEGLSLALHAVAKPGDVIAVESPAYFGVLQTIEGLNLRALEVPSHSRTGLDVGAFEETIKQQRVAALVVTPTVSNPQGAIMPDDERERLVRICKRADIPIIEDDVYGELVFDGTRPRPLRAFDDEIVVHVSSVSKTLAPGYRVGWIAGGRWHDQIVRKKYSHTLACPALLGMAVAEFLASGGYDRHLRRLRTALAGNVERYREGILTEFPDGTRVSSPRGGFVLWVELPPGIDALALHEAALRRGIVVAPGPLFSARQRFGNFIRISAGTPWSERISASIRTLGRLVAKE